MKKINSLINVDENIDNLMTLIYSQNDVFDGTLSYLYYKVLNMKPSKYAEFEEEDFNTEEELLEMDNDFVKFEEWKFNKTIKTELEETVVFIRKIACEEGILKKFGDYYIINKDYQYSSTYLLKCIYKYYSEKKEKRINEANN